VFLLGINEKSLIIRGKTTIEMIQFIRKLTRTSTHSYSVIIPREVVQGFGWRERQKLILEVDPRTKEVIIRDWKEGEMEKKVLI